MSVNQAKEKRRSERRFNVIDAFIIILVLLCVVGIYFRSQIAEWIGVEKNLEEYRISFEVSEIRYTSGKYIASGNEVYLDGSGIHLGTIDGNSTILPSEMYVENSSGDQLIINYPKDTRVDVTGQIKCMGIKKSDGFYLNGTYSLSPGSTLNVYTEMLNFSFTITDIAKYNG